MNAHFNSNIHRGFNERSNPHWFKEKSPSIWGIFGKFSVKNRFGDDGGMLLANTDESGSQCCKMRDASLSTWHSVEPVDETDDVEGRGGQYVLKMGLGETDVT